MGQATAGGVGVHYVAACRQFAQAQGHRLAMGLLFQHQVLLRVRTESHLGRQYGKSVGVSLNYIQFAFDIIRTPVLITNRSLSFCVLQILS